MARTALIAVACIALLACAGAAEGAPPRGAALLPPPTDRARLLGQPGITADALPSCLLF